MSVSETPQVARRRRALQRVLDGAGMRPADAARAAGLPTANSIYNFLHGHSNSLSQSTLEKLARVVPGATMAKLTGLEEVTASDVVRSVVVRMEARAGVGRAASDLPPHEQFEVPAPIRPEYMARGAFGVLVRTPGAERLYPDGTVLICLPYDTYPGTLTAGRRVVLQRLDGHRTEITVNELGFWREQAWLWPRTDDPAHQQPVAVPSLDRPRWRDGETDYVLAAAAILALVPEDGLALR